MADLEICQVHQVVEETPTLSDIGTHMFFSKAFQACCLEAFWMRKAEHSVSFV